MATLYSLLALPKAVTDNLQYVLIGAGVLIALIAFIIGCVKGCSRMGWGALVWGVAAAAFLLFEIKFADKNPLAKAEALNKLPEGVKNGVLSLSIALAAILAASLVFGLISSLVCRKKKSRSHYYYREKMLPGTYNNYDGDDEYKEGYNQHADFRLKNTYKTVRINGFNRFMGGIFAVVQTAVVLAAIGGLALVAIKAFPSFAGKMDSVYNNAVMAKLWKYVHAYALDLIWMSVIFAFARAGFRAGCIKGFRSIFRTVGSLAAVAFLAVPFIPAITSMKAFAFVGKVSTFCGGVVAKFIPAVGAYSSVIGKVVCAIVLAIACGVLVWAIGLLLKTIGRAGRQSLAFRLVDGTISFFVMMAIGVAVCLLLTALLYTPEYFGKTGFFLFKNAFSEESVLAKGFYETVVQYVKPWLDKLMALAK